jgi:hypothetical protein
MRMSLFLAQAQYFVKQKSGEDFPKHRLPIPLKKTSLDSRQYYYSTVLKQKENRAVLNSTDRTKKRRCVFRTPFTQ